MHNMYLVKLFNHLVLLLKVEEVLEFDEDLYVCSTS